MFSFPGTLGGDKLVNVYRVVNQPVANESGRAATSSHWRMWLPRDRRPVPHSPLAFYLVKLGIDAQDRSALFQLENINEKVEMHSLQRSNAIIRAQQ